MESLKEEIEKKKEWLIGREKSVDDLKQELKHLKKSREITMSVLYSALESIDLKGDNSVVEGMMFDKRYESYQKILGGDGRSQPWDEKKEGLVCYIKSNYWFTEEQKRALDEYLKNNWGIKKVYLLPK